MSCDITSAIFYRWYRISPDSLWGEDPRQMNTGKCSSRSHWWKLAVTGFSDFQCLISLLAAKRSHNLRKASKVPLGQLSGSSFPSVISLPKSGPDINGASWGHSLCGSSLSAASAIRFSQSLGLRIKETGYLLQTPPYNRNKGMRHVHLKRQRT